MDGFIANLFEFFGVANQGNFSNDMYNNGYYMPIFLILVILVAVVATCYYYAVNHPRVNRWYHWLFFNLGTGLVNFGLTWIISSDKIVAYYGAQGMDSPYDWTNYLILSSIALLWTGIFFFVFSFIIKWGSSNCKRTPFL